jgi:hypothetical protein
MFQSIRCTKYLDYDEKTKLYNFEFELTDSEFGTVVCADPGAGAGPDTGAVISEYKKRGLDVKTNLLKLFEFYRDQYNWSIKYQIEWGKKYQPLFKEYENQFELCAQCGEVHL